jgi:hypothetical protein
MDNKKAFYEYAASLGVKTNDAQRLMVLAKNPQQKGNYKGVGKYSDKYVKWLEDEVLRLREQTKIAGY